ncbi:MAG TPA: nuclear transport factor 2 family protein, partial [Novosphingobium sp.]|nr:nuclear transport factor 2 family protein [Novosphingobium sp.]
LDQLEIQDCLTRFSRGMDRFDRACFLSAFWPDATIAAGPFVGTPAECWDWAVPMHEAAQVLTHHALLNMTIEVAGEEAHAETYYLFVARNRDESLWQAGGRYVDRLERRDGDWRIAMRANVIEWSANPPSMPLPFADVPGIARNGTSRRDGDDISYARPLINRREPSIPG